VDEKDIGNDATLIEVLNAAAFNGKAIVEATSSQKVKDQLKANTERAVANGVVGVPTFQVDGGDVLWGQDHFNVLLDFINGWKTRQDNESAHARL